MNKDVFRKLRQMLMEELDLSRELSDKEILDVIDELILNQIKDVRLALKEKVQLRQELFYSVRKLDVLQELVDDETVTEIMVNGPDTIFVERAGKLMKWHKSFTSAEKLEDVIQQIVGKCNRVINESMPIVDARLENGSRVNAVIYPVALNGPILTIRRFPEHPITMEKLIALGSITQECAEFLEKLVKARYSMVIGGGTGSGKTTFLAAMSEYIPRDERLITIEDNAELRIRGIDNLVRLEAKMANMEGAVSVTIRDLIKSAMMISIWSPLLICVVIGSSLWLILALMALFPIFEWMSYAKSSAVAPNGIFRASPLGVNTTISEVYSDNLKLSRKSTAFSVGLFSAERICLSHLSNSSSSCEMVACLYFQCAANPLSAMSSMRWVRICTSTHTPSGPITVECSAS